MIIEAMARRSFLKRLGGGIAGARALAAPGMFGRMFGRPAAPPAWKPTYWTGLMQQNYNRLRSKFIKERTSGFLDAAGVFHPPVALADAKAQWAMQSETFGKLLANRADAGIQKNLSLHRGDLVDFDATGERGFLNPRPNPEGDAIEAENQRQAAEDLRIQDERVREAHRKYDEQQRQRRQRDQPQRRIVANGRNERDLPREQMESLVDALLE
jgi:hypothetical protein